MSKSKRLRLLDVRNALRLVGECRDFGADVLAWRTHMLDGMSRLISGRVAVGAEVRITGAGHSPALSGFVDRGWPSASARQFFLQYVANGALSEDPTLRVCMLRARPLVSRRREQVIDDRQWYKSLIYNEYRRPAESDDWLGSVAALSNPSGFHILSFDRPPSAARFSERERRLVHFFHHELVRLLPTILARDADWPHAGLSPRLRQVLESLMEGDSEKQTAARLELSRHTVHDYVKTLYRRFDVSSRSELLARLLRRPTQHLDRSPPGRVK